MASGSETVSVLDQHGSIRPTPAAEPYVDRALAVPLEQRIGFLRHMVRTRASMRSTTLLRSGMTSSRTSIPSPFSLASITSRRRAS